VMLGVVQWIIVLCLFFVFFFQAEDGIRDKLVTGVQTCALPIYSASVKSGDTTVTLAESVPGWKSGDRIILTATTRQNKSLKTFRSEERRVGKECRSRGAGGE